MRSLYLLSAFRALRQNFFFWSFLFSTYSLIAAIVISPFIEAVLGEALPLLVCAMIGGSILLISAGLSGVTLLVPFPEVRRSTLFLLPLFSELRNLSFYIVILSCALAGLFFGEEKSGHLLLVVLLQIPCQYLLFRIHKWRRFFLENSGIRAAFDYLVAIAVSSLFSCGVLFAIQCALWFDFTLSGLAIAVAVPIATSMVALEGDSGARGLVNVLSFASGLFLGAFTSEWPLVAPVLVLVFLRFAQVSRSRFQTVEEVFDDVAI